MRRRLWHTIGWLDMQASLSSASEPMIQSNWLSFSSFHRKVDEEFGLDFPILHETISDASIFHLISYAQETARYLAVSKSGALHTNAPRQRQKLVSTFKTRTDELLVGLRPDHVDLHWFLKQLSHSIGVSLQLLAIRPLENIESLENSQIAGANMLKLAAEVLNSRNQLYSNKKAEPWRWNEPLFFPWQALAIALAEIRGCEDCSLMESLWPLIEKSYMSFTAFFRESPHHWLRHSMKRLMERARDFYNHILQSYILNENGDQAFTWDLVFPTISQHQSPPLPTEPQGDGSHRLPYGMGFEVNDAALWIGNSESDFVDFFSLAPDM